MKKLSEIILILISLACLLPPQYMFAQKSATNNNFNKNSNSTLNYKPTSPSDLSESHRIIADMIRFNNHVNNLEFLNKEDSINKLRLGVNFYQTHLLHLKSKNKNSHQPITGLALNLSYHNSSALGNNFYREFYIGAFTSIARLDSHSLQPSLKNDLKESILGDSFSAKANIDGKLDFINTDLFGKDSGLKALMGIRFQTTYNVNLAKLENYEVYAKLGVPILPHLTIFADAGTGKFVSYYKDFLFDFQNIILGGGINLHSNFAEINAYVKSYIPFDFNEMKRLNFPTVVEWGLELPIKISSLRLQGYYKLTTIKHLADFKFDPLRSDLGLSLGFVPNENFSVFLSAGATSDTNDLTKFFDEMDQVRATASLQINMNL